MDHFAKFHQNRTVNEPEKAILLKLSKPEKWWCLVPKNQEPRNPEIWIILT